MIGGTCLAGVAVVTVDKFGRRPLLLIGVGGMFASALLIGIACQVAYGSAAATYITIVMLFIFVGSYQVTSPLTPWAHSKQTVCELRCERTIDTCCIQPART